MKLNVILVAALGSAGLGLGGWAQAGLPGGWAAVARPTKECAAAATFAVQEQGKAMAKHSGARAKKLALLQVLGAEEQVVAGVRYRLKLKVKVGDAEKVAQAEVWWQAWRKPDPHQLLKWTWK